MKSLDWNLGFPDSSVGKESACNAGGPQVQFGVGKICWRRDRLPTPIFLGFPCGSAGKESARNSRDLGSIPGLGRSPREGKDYPLQCSSLENTVHGVTKNWTQLSDFQFQAGTSFSSCHRLTGIVWVCLAFFLSLFSGQLF